MHERSKIMSHQFFKKVIGLSQDIDNVKFDFFNEGIRAGKKLTYDELKKLSIPVKRELIQEEVRVNSDLKAYN